MCSQEGSKEQGKCRYFWVTLHHFLLTDPKLEEFYASSNSNSMGLNSKFLNIRHHYRDKNDQLAKKFG